MARKRIHNVTPPKDKKAKMTITFSVEQQLTWDRAARRKAQIESGTFVRGGIHGGGKREQNKRERRDSRQQSRNYQNED